MNELTLRSYFSNYFGYGLHGLQILKDFDAFGYKVRGIPIGVDFRDENFRHGRTDDDAFIRRVIVGDDPAYDREVVLGLPYLQLPDDGRKRVFFTMWDTNRLPLKGVENLNRMSHVIVPSEWNASLFNASGVNAPLSISQLGIDTSVYNYVPPNVDGPCVFGTGGRQTAGGIRKNIHELIAVFTRAFPDQKDVRLHLKTFPDEATVKTFDPRVKITNAFLSPRNMAVWYAELTAYVSFSNSEGWGLMPQQAMAVGRPTIAPKFGGMREYFDEGVGYPVDYRLVPCGGIYAQDTFSAGGYWAKVDEDALIEQMRWVYANRGHAHELGKTASERALRYSWQAAHRRLEKVLLDIHYFD